MCTNQLRYLEKISKHKLEAVLYYYRFNALHLKIVLFQLRILSFKVPKEVFNMFVMNAFTNLRYRVCHMKLRRYHSIFLRRIFYKIQCL